jgi:hypothetical protein
MFEMDIVVIDAPDAWGMLINRKAATDLGGNLQMDLTMRPSLPQMEVLLS